MQQDDLTKIKNKSILLIRNTKGNILNQFFWWLLRKGMNTEYNHCQLVRSFESNKRLYICESTISGFHITRTLDQWIAEQKTMQRSFSVINMDGFDEGRFYTILGNRYDAKYWTTLLKIYSGEKSTNCFQSIAYIFNLPNWWLATAKTFY
jgi:hypothetical protein